MVTFVRNANFAVDAVEVLLLTVTEAPTTGLPSASITRPDTISPVSVGKMLYITTSTTDDE